jgi:hypothetical protein
MTRLTVLPPSPLPPLYDRWMRALLPAPIPHEPHATCDVCAMCAEGADAKPAASMFFDPGVKCCSYTPILANYLVGRALVDPSPDSGAGRASVTARIRAGVGVSPLGLQQPPTYRVLYEQTAPATFGRSLSLRCPHYIDEHGGRCGIWRHRSSVCTTWFCKHERGALGERFWMALHHLLSRAEHALAQWCVVELDIGDEALAKVVRAAKLAAQVRSTPYTLDDVSGADAAGDMWGRWSGRELEFYEACAAMVERLAWPEVVAIAGIEVRALERVVLAAFADLVSETLPERLVLAPVQIVDMQPESCRVKTYSLTDLLDLPRALFETFRYFDGRPIAAVLEDIETSEGIRLDPALVRHLVDFRILVGPETPSSGR